MYTCSCTEECFILMPIIIGGFHNDYYMYNIHTAHLIIILFFDLLLLLVVNNDSGVLGSILPMVVQKAISLGLNYNFELIDSTISFQDLMNDVDRGWYYFLDFFFILSSF